MNDDGYGPETKGSPKFMEEELSDIKRKSLTPSRIAGCSQTKSDNSLKGLAKLINGKEVVKLEQNQPENSMEFVPSFEDPKKPLNVAISFAISPRRTSPPNKDLPNQTFNDGAANQDLSSGGIFDPTTAIINLTFENDS